MVMAASQLLSAVSAALTCVTNVVWLFSLNLPELLGPTYLLLHHFLSASTTSFSEQQRFESPAFLCFLCRSYQRCSIVTKSTSFTETWRWVLRNVIDFQPWLKPQEGPGCFAEERRPSVGRDSGKCRQQPESLGIKSVKIVELYPE